MNSCRSFLFFASLSALFAVAACDPTGGVVRERQVGFDASTAAVVNGEPIYISDVELEAVAQGRIEPGEAFGPDHTEYQIVLEQLIDQRLLAQEAVRRGLDRSPQAQRRLEKARDAASVPTLGTPPTVPGGSAGAAPGMSLARAADLTNLLHFELQDVLPVF